MIFTILLFIVKAINQEQVAGVEEWMATFKPCSLWENIISKEVATIELLVTNMSHSVVILLEKPHIKFIIIRGTSQL